MKSITLTALGLTGSQWIKRLETEGYKISEYAKQVLNSPDYDCERMKKGEKVTVQFVSVKDLNQTVATTQEIKDFAKTKGWEMPKGELALLIREAISDKQMEDMGVYYIEALHEPINDSVGNPRVLIADRYDGGRWVDAYWGDPSRQWYGSGAFAFPLVASPSYSDTQPSFDSSSLEQRVEALEKWQQKFIGFAKNDL